MSCPDQVSVWSWRECGCCCGDDGVGIRRSCPCESLPLLTPNPHLGILLQISEKMSPSMLWYTRLTWHAALSPPGKYLQRSPPAPTGVGQAGLTQRAPVSIPYQVNCIFPAPNSTTHRESHCVWYGLCKLYSMVRHLANDLNCILNQFSSLTVPQPDPQWADLNSYHFYSLQNQGFLIFLAICCYKSI